MLKTSILLIYLIKSIKIKTSILHNKNNSITINCDNVLIADDTSVELIQIKQAKTKNKII